MSRILIVMALSICLISWCGRAAAQEAGLSKSVEDVLSKRIEFVKGTLSGDPVIVEAVRESNEKNRGLSLKEILKLDDRWRGTEGIDEFIKGYIANECSDALVEFQDEHDGYPEIFVADAKGLVVGATNKTSDLYQADEEWWVECYSDGKGKTAHGEIEYDESAMSEAIAVCVPVMDKETGRAIGVMKILVDITAIKMEL